MIERQRETMEWTEDRDLADWMERVHKDSMERTPDDDKGFWEMIHRQDMERMGR